MLIAQISDSHVMPAGQLAYGEYDTAASLRRVVEHLSRLDPRPDLVMVTGDLVDNGSAEAYAVARSILKRLPMPYYVLPGNHDHRERMRTAFIEDGYLPAAGFLNYVVDAGPVRILALDTNDHGRQNAKICPERMSWLERQLAAEPSRPTIVAMHHPPFPSGLVYMDVDRPDNVAELEALIARHPQVERIICGHLHRPISVRFGGTVASSCGGACHQLVLDLRSAPQPASIPEPPGFQLHQWNRAFGLVSHTGVVGDFVAGKSFAYAG